MQTYKNKISTTHDNRRVLVIGDSSMAFSDIGLVEVLPWQRCGNMLDAIVLAKEANFATIFVVASSFGGRLESALEALRRVSGKAKIVLLVQMYDEPAARELIFRQKSSPKPADDYFICPVDPAMLETKTMPRERAADQQQRSLLQSDYKDRRIRELEKLATEDDLTGLKNRRYIREFLRQIIERAKREELQVTLLVFDIDDFKHYNDAYSHAVGDNVLRQAAVMMGRCCRSHDVIGRIGGDEFAVVFWDRPDDRGKPTKDKKVEHERRQATFGHPHEAFFMAERFRKEISSAELTFLGPKGKGELTISGGLASFPQNGTTVGELFEQADKAMLEAKRNGKNRILLVGTPK